MGLVRHSTSVILVSLVLIGYTHVHGESETTTFSSVNDEALVITTVVPGDSSGEALFDANNDLGSPTENPVGSEPEAAGVNTRSGDKLSKKDTSKPDIYSFHVQSDIRYRYSRTYVTSRVANRHAEKSQEVTFRVVLPETAFISKFVMEIDGKPYEAFVKRKEEAKNIYNAAQSQGQSAGLVELNTRNSNIFNVNVNIKAQSKVNFKLTYEELLQRRLGRYEQSINISPEQINNVQDFQVVVNIEESQNITLLRVPQLRNDIEAQEDEEGNNKDAVIERPAGNKANITWKPTAKDQAALSKQGITGKFIVQYDIKRELDSGEVLVMNGYFVHFFAPANLAPLRKHVVFILDISGSMWGRKIEQLKEAMNKILADLTPDDFFNIITFSSEVNLWGPDDKVQQEPTNSWQPPAYLGETAVPAIMNDLSKQQPFPATKANIQKAQSYISALVASGGTNIHDAIVRALNLTSFIKSARKAATQGLETSLNTTGSSTTESSTTAGTTGSAVPTTELPATGSTVTPTARTKRGNKKRRRSNKENVLNKPVTILPVGVESLIIFLTDGEPTVGVTNPTQIQTLIQAANKNNSIPIFSLGFGEGADFPFVRKLSLQNNGFARKIYEASDAAIQLKGFYNEIASPLLSNVTFNYTSPEFEVSNLTTTKFITVFGGTEIAVCGTLTPIPGNNTRNTTLDVEILGDANSTTTPIPRLEDSLALPKSLDAVDVEFVPTDKYNFNVVVDGYGRKGSVKFIKPEIFSSPIPWGVPVIQPWPPRPTPPPTQEDTFLEKMWAYLTIKQLIDQDLAIIDSENEVPDDDGDMAGSAETTTPKDTSPVTPLALPSNNLTMASNGTLVANATTVKETPKQRALRLALKYGFVTPLTSLVVVKPNQTDVTDAVPSDAKPELADSMSGGRSLMLRQNPMSTYLMSPLTASNNNVNSHRRIKSGGSIGIRSRSGSGGGGGGVLGKDYVRRNSAPQSMYHFTIARPLHKTVPVKFAATANRISSGGFQLLPLSLQAQRPAGFNPSPSFPILATHLAGGPGGPVGFGGPANAGGRPPAPPPTMAVLTTSFASESLMPTTTRLSSVYTTSFTTTPPQAVDYSYDAELDISSMQLTTPRLLSTTVRTPTTPKTPTPLTLKSLDWFSENTTQVQVDQTVYKIAVNETDGELSAFIKGAQCTIQTTNQNGTCQHLRDCVQEPFIHDITVYKTQYLCGISSTTEATLYAGVCCPTRQTRGAVIF